ncbi:uncharacterized protein DSM5745_05133 [Aspergillus mulundensis]|uniref:HNH nuclease domain-containing protein n=1 Tax=Aspergillus mulundensis TaxID=1810919 RepID=A0A3D8S5P6_9EURO|nr:hypothetical protein DSM5745_05133 [Aspergillus mulundensis]RDW81576.1 hypothetical protein DSM5745_05133 [Aspergillus mulundensis]
MELMEVESNRTEQHPDEDQQVQDTEPFPALIDSEEQIMTDAPNLRRRDPVQAASSPDENYCERTPERDRVLEKLRVILDLEDVPVPFWAFCQVADLQTLQGLVRQFIGAPDLTPLALQSCFAVPRLWAQKVPRFADYLSSSSESSSRSSGRSRRLPELARERDGGVCVLTKTALCDVAHIYAHCLIEPKKQSASDKCAPIIWTVLKLFWPSEKIARWKDTILPNNGQGEDGLHNLICMSPHLQRAWAEGRFALRPLRLSDDRTAMELEFHWLPVMGHRYDADIAITAPTLSTRGLDEVDNFFFYKPTGGRTGEKVMSGAIFTIRTPDPQRLPLPSFDLLEIAWHLARIVSMSAAGSRDEDGFSFDDDDDAGNHLSMPDKLIEDWIPPPPSPSSFASEIRGPHLNQSVAHQNPD